MKPLITILVLTLALVSVGIVPARQSTRNRQKLDRRAAELHRQSLVIDTHMDTLQRVLIQGADLGVRSNNGQSDLPRLKAGGVDAQFFAVWPDPMYAPHHAARRTLQLIDAMYGVLNKYPDRIELARNAADLERIVASGKLAALMGIEGGHAIEDSLSALRMFHRLGVRYMTLTHTNTNNWADSAGGINNPPEKRYGGLSEFGREVVLEMNRLGMMVDISHVGDETFWDCIETSQAPLIASHSSCRTLTNVPRNLTDEMLQAVGKKGGVVMINFYNGFINTDYAKPGGPAPTRAAETATMDMLMAHFEHAIKLAGIDHVGIGSDFDGVDGLLPAGMEDVSKLPAITWELLKRGYSERDVRKILGENLLRTMAEVERVARKMQSAGKAPSFTKLQKK